MSRFKEMTIEELLDMEQQLVIEKRNGDYDALLRLIEVRERIYRRIRSDRESEYKALLNMIKNTLISDLITYGSYLKTEYRKDDIAAEQSLKKVLRYDAVNKIANYRLGFLTFKNRRYIEAMLYYQRALKAVENSDQSPYVLTAQQKYNATLYLSNSALYIATDAHESLDEITEDINRGGLASLEMSPIYEYISSTEDYLRKHEFIVKTSSGEEGHSNEECEEIVNDPNLDTLILYYRDQEIEVAYNGKGVPLSLRQAELFEMLLASSEEHQTTRLQYIEEVKLNTFIKRINRLREKLTELDLPQSVIINHPIRLDHTQNETAYYYDQTVPHMIIKRIDNV